MNTELYLSKLNLKAQAPSLGFLNEIISAHQRLISFNNLAVFFHPGEILNLDIGPLFDKVILRQEGGYCFENNKVLFFLLQGLGFEVQPKSARVIYDKVGDVPRTHRTTIVTIDGGRYLADVGFGRDVPPHAVPIGVGQKSGHQVIMHNDLYYHQLWKEDSPINLYSFDDGFYSESDFAVANYYTNTHPSSKFVKELIVSRRDGDLIEFISGKTFSRIQNKEREDIKITTQEEFQFFLEKFGIKAIYDFSSLPMSK